jgi:hypothetical protein
MSDWTDFCDNEGIDPNNPDQFDEWLSDQQEPEPRSAATSSLLLSHRELLAGLADPRCPRCAGTGYLARYHWHFGGRCFMCLPDARWYPARRDLAVISNRLLYGTHRTA